MKLDFNDTQTAFKHKSTKDLVQAKRLFQMFSYPFLVEKGPRIANFALAIGLPIKGIIKSTIFHQFCGGEDIQSSHSSAQQLYSNGIGAILDYSVEGKGSEKSYDHTYEELDRTIQFAAAHEEYPFAVFKCSGLGSIDVMQKVSDGDDLSEREQDAFDRFLDRVDRLCKRSHDLDVRLFIDAEESWIQTPLDDMTYRMMAKYNREKAIVFNTIQLYRKNRLEHMKTALLVAEKDYYIGYKLVRGAYMEKEWERAFEMNYPNPIQENKEDTDKDFNAAVSWCIENADRVSLCAGTHNEESCMHMAEVMDSHGIAKHDDRFWFAQLYGMSDHISYNLAKEGYRVAKYLPYGPVRKVLPYLARRAKENSSVRGQAGRELMLINKEISRRNQGRSM